MQTSATQSSAYLLVHVGSVTSVDEHPGIIRADYGRPLPLIIGPTSPQRIASVLPTLSEIFSAMTASMEWQDISVIFETHRDKINAIWPINTPLYPTLALPGRSAIYLAHDDVRPLTMIPGMRLVYWKTWFLDQALLFMVSLGRAEGSWASMYQWDFSRLPVPVPPIIPTRPTSPSPSRHSSTHLAATPTQFPIFSQSPPSQRTSSRNSGNSSIHNRNTLPTPVQESQSSHPKVGITNTTVTTTTTIVTEIFGDDEAGLQEGLSTLAL